MSPTVRSLDEHDDLDAASRARRSVDAFAFGEPVDDTAVAAMEPLVDPARWYLAEVDGQPCGVAGSFALELTVPGGATVDVGAVTDVGVLPTHRRRGVLRELMRRQLHDLAESGAVAAVLNASEAAIYRRFGYGVSTRWRQIALDARRTAFRVGWPDPGGSYHAVDRAEAAADCAAVHDRARRVRAGGLSRGAHWWPVIMGDVELYLGGGSKRLVILHRDAAGVADGYVIYDVDHDWSTGQSEATLRVWELVGVDQHVELGLWRTVLDHDLVGTVTGPIAPDHLLWDVVVDPRQVRTRWDQDLLWTRLLDVPAALGARRYQAPGAVTIEVVDALRPEVAGTYRLESDLERSRCVRVDHRPELRTDISELGACWLGGGSFRRSVRAGWTAELSPGAANAADLMFGTDPLPWCWTRF